MPVEDLRQSPMIGHVLDALDRGEDIGHYGRLVFATMGRHFVGEAELVEILTKDHDADEREIRAMVQQVQEKGYSPPRREKLLEYQGQQDFQICPNPDDPMPATLTRNYSSRTRSTRASKSTNKKDKAPDANL